MLVILSVLNRFVLVLMGSMTFLARMIKQSDFGMLIQGKIYTSLKGIRVLSLKFVIALMGNIFYPGLGIKPLNYGKPFNKGNDIV